LEELKTDKLVAKNLTNEMNTRFGKQCFVGMSYNPGFDVKHRKNNLIWFSYKQKQILLFKHQSNGISDQIVEAQRDNAKVVLVYNDVEEKIKNSILNTKKYVLKNFNTFKGISYNMKNL
jgi:hypothetical protein